jgi:hypothetical protein
MSLLFPLRSKTTYSAPHLNSLDDFVTGLIKLSSRAGIPTYKIHECYLRYDIDDDGIDEELLSGLKRRNDRFFESVS